MGQDNKTLLTVAQEVTFVWLTCAPVWCEWSCDKMEILPSHSSSRSLTHRSNRALYHFSSLSLSLDLWQSWVFSPFESVPGKRANVKLAASAFPRVVFLPKVSKRQPLIWCGYCGVGARWEILLFFSQFSHHSLKLETGKVDRKSLFFENKHAFNQTLKN